MSAFLNLSELSRMFVGLIEYAGSCQDVNLTCCAHHHTTTTTTTKMPGAAYTGVACSTAKVYLRTVKAVMRPVSPRQWRTGQGGAAGAAAALLRAVGTALPRRQDLGSSACLLYRTDAADE